jgi:phosphatidylglycerol:prolipoprotein diacylglycerol transferase
MYPDLSYLFHDLFGTEPDNWTSIFKTFGLLLVISILAASWMLYRELKRKAGEGLFSYKEVKKTVGQGATTTELVWNALFGFIVGFKVVYLFQHFDEFQADAAAVILSGKGTWWAGILGAIIFGGMRYWEKNKLKLPKPKIVTEKIYPHDRIGDITIIAAVSGIVGAKVFALIEDLPAFFNDPVGMFFSGSGLAIYGGLIGGFLGCWWYFRKNNIEFLPVLDAVAPALMVSYGVGRLGCHFSGDGDWGIEAAAQPNWWFLPDWLWAYNYPNNVAQDGQPIPGCDFQYCMELVPSVYPTPLYEFVMAMALGAILWGMRKRLKVVGMLFFIYLIMNGAERFLIEKIRVNDHYNVLGVNLTQAEIIAIFMFIAGAVGIYLVRKRHTTE